MPWQLPQQPAPSNKDSSLNAVGEGPVWVRAKSRNLTETNMSPKKKAKNATKKNPAKSGNDLEALEHRRNILDISVLQDHIALQHESLIKVRDDRSDLRRRVRNMEQTLQLETQDHRDICSDLSRQYKTMHAGLTNKVKRLEGEVSQLKEALALCQEELRKEKREREELEEEKDAAVRDLQHKLDNMETDYEKILHETLDSLTSQLSVLRQGWEDKSTALHENYKEVLSEFGLNALDM